MKLASLMYSSSTSIVSCLSDEGAYETMRTEPPMARTTPRTAGGEGRIVTLCKGEGSRADGLLVALHLGV
jgi:hypothetical protein